MTIQKSNSGTGANTGSHSWFQDWFNSPYYFKLYKNRDEQEAHRFINQLLLELKPEPGATILDLACGRGRYSRYLAEMGFDVTGIDIAEHSIEYARQFENDNLSFFIHDMRVPYRVNFFNYVFNFFTSFGYFDTEKEHLNTVMNIGKGLKPDGKFVLDFFNSKRILRNLKESEVKQVKDITFHIERRKVEHGYVEKEIRFEDTGQSYRFIERVRAFTLDDFEVMFGKARMKIASTFGDYQLNEFDEETSERLILIGCKSGC